MQAISKYVHKDTIDPSACLVPPEVSKKLIGVKTVENSKKNGPLPHTFFNKEHIKKKSIPAQIRKLVHIDEEQKSHKGHNLIILFIQLKICSILYYIFYNYPLVNDLYFCIVK